MRSSSSRENLKPNVCQKQVLKNSQLLGGAKDSKGSPRYSLSSQQPVKKQEKQKKRSAGRSGSNSGTRENATNSHKKSQSLFNSKIADIISGLQQSLGVIATNMKNSFSTEEAAALTQMTS